jgi:predicted aspartyl protease
MARAEKSMGTFHVACQVENIVDRERQARVPRVLVDTGSEYSWIAQEILVRLGVAPEKKGMRFLTADGRTVTRTVGFAIIRVGGHFTVDEVVFAKKGDLELLGARTLEGLNLTVDSRRKKLVAGGPVPAAGALRR